MMIDYLDILNIREKPPPPRNAVLVSSEEIPQLQ